MRFSVQCPHQLALRRGDEHARRSRHRAGGVAFDFGLIDERFFVTLVLVAIVTSLIAGAWFHYAVRRNLPLLDDNS